MIGWVQNWMAGWGPLWAILGGTLGWAVPSYLQHRQARVDHLDPPLGVRLEMSERGRAMALEQGDEPLSPLPLQTHYKGRRFYWGRTRVWYVILPDPVAASLASGFVDLVIDKLPPRTVVKVEVLTLTQMFQHMKDREKGQDSAGD